MCKYTTIISSGKINLPTLNRRALPHSGKVLICFCLYIHRTDKGCQKRYLQPKVSVEGWKWRSAGIAAGDVGSAYLADTDDVLQAPPREVDRTMSLMATPKPAADPDVNNLPRAIR